MSTNSEIVNFFKELRQPEFKMSRLSDLINKSRTIAEERRKVAIAPAVRVDSTRLLSSIVAVIYGAAVLIFDRSSLPNLRAQARQNKCVNFCPSLNLSFNINTQSYRHFIEPKADFQI